MRRDGAAAARLTCPLCQGTNAAVLFRGHPGYQEPDVFDIARCADCNTSFVPVSGLDTQPIYDAIYRQVESVPGYSRYATFAKAVDQHPSPLAYLAAREVTYWGIRHVLETIGLRADETAVEIGSGLGYLTAALNRSGIPTIGIDVSAVAVQKAAERYGPYFVCGDLESYAVAHAGEYAVAIATEVIEHIEDVYPFLESGLKLLKPGGRLLVTTPNREAWTPEVVWEGEAPPVHLWWFSRGSFRAIADRLGCEVDFADASGSPHARSWRLRHVPGSPRAVKMPVLDEHGELVPELRPTSPWRHLARRIRRVLRSVSGARSAVTVAAPDTATRGPSPTLVAVLRKADRNG